MIRPAVSRNLETHDLLLVGNLSAAIAIDGSSVVTNSDANVMARLSKSDEEYLVNAAIKCQENDPYAAKSWLITARTLFPKSFRVQFESYNLEKKARNPKAAASCILSIYNEFKNSDNFWKELKKIWEAISSESQDEESKLFQDIFSEIPKDMQQSILLSASDNSTDTLEQCNIIYLALKLFPKCVQQHGMPLVDLILSSETCIQPYTPINVYRSMLVREVLPLLLKSPYVNINPDRLYQLLIKAMEYYVMLPIKNYPSRNIESSQNVQPESTDHQQSWRELFDLTQNIGKKLNWELHDIFAAGTSTESQWQQIHNMYVFCMERKNNPMNPMLQSQIMMCSLILFLYCLHQYSVTCNSVWFSNLGSSLQPMLLLVESCPIFTDSSDALNHALTSGNHSSVKDLSLTDSNVVPRVSQGVKQSVASLLIHHFMTAVKCYHLLISDPLLQAEFHQVQMCLKMDMWPWYYSFQTDAHIFHEKYNFAINKLSLMQSYGDSGDQVTNIKCNLQMACCLFMSRDFRRCIEKILDVVSSLSNVESGDNFTKYGNKTFAKPGRNLQFISFVFEEILSYCVDLIISCLKSLPNHLYKDHVLGHMIVLLQYDWPNGEDEFINILDRIRHQGSFNYNLFFNYVTNIEILEEIAFLGNTENKNFVNLDLLSSSVQLTRQRTITRGINKEVKEDFRATLEKQAAVCSTENIQQIIMKFLTKERNLILLCFSA